jgi:hypothetical protein
VGNGPEDENGLEKLRTGEMDAGDIEFESFHFHYNRFCFRDKAGLFKRAALFPIVIR